MRAVILSFCLIAPGLYLHPARQAPNGQQAPLQYEVSVTLKLIQVYVMDQDGKPVRDLTKEDFAVFDDGKLVTVTDFERHELLTSASLPETQAAAGPASAATLQTGMSRKFILLFDFAFNNQKGGVAAIVAAQHFLDTEVRPDDEVALISYSSLKGLRVHEYLTRDHAKVRLAMGGLSGKEIAGRAEEIEDLYWRAAQDQSSLDAASKYSLNWRRQEAKSLANNYFVMLTSLAKAMRLVAGQKNIIFFSMGIPYSLIYGSQAGISKLDRTLPRGKFVQPSTFDMGDNVLQPLAEGMLKEFSASNCSFFAFDTRESAKVQTLFTPEEMTSETGDRSTFSSDGVFQTKTDLLRDDKTTGQDMLRRLSKQTGGQYFSNISLYEKNLEAVQNITGTYYVLGYSITAPRDGDFHKIKVEVKRKGCKVQTQAGYFDPKPFRDYTDLEKQIQLFDLALNERSEGRAPKTFGVTALSYDAGGGPRVRLLSRIPKETLRAFGGKTVEFVSLAFDEAGNPVGLCRATTDPAKQNEKDLAFASGMTLQPGRYRCRVIARDMETGESALGSTDVNIVRPAAAKLALFTPLLLIPGKACTQLEASQKGKIDFVPWQDIYPYDAAGFSPVVGEISREVGKVVVVVPWSAPEPEQLNVALSAKLISMADGQSVPVTISALERSTAGSIEVARFELPLDQVPPGKYQLYIYAADKDRGVLAQTHVPLAVSAATGGN